MILINNHNLSTLPISNRTSKNFENLIVHSERAYCFTRNIIFREKITTDFVSDPFLKESHSVLTYHNHPIVG